MGGPANKHLISHHRSRLVFQGHLILQRVEPGWRLGPHPQRPHAAPTGRDLVESDGAAT